MDRKLTFVLTAVAVLGTLGALGPGPKLTHKDPTCVGDHLLEGPGTPGTLAWSESGEVTRKVTVFFDDTGEPLQYTEMKSSGPLRRFQRQGTYRLLHLNFDTGFAVVETQGPDGGRIQEQREILSVLESSALGNPSETIQWIRSRCMDVHESADGHS